jgi:cytochrome oxidase assembly protein ShyY1
MTFSRLNAASLSCLLLAILGLGLGLWQWQRSLYKLDLAERQTRTYEGAVALGVDSSSTWQEGLQAEDWDQRRVTLHGAWRQGRQIYLDNRAHQGRAGVHVIAALELPDGSVAWVNRGWAPKQPGLADRNAGSFENGQAYPLSEGAQMLEAVGQASIMRRIELSSDPNALRQGALWQNFDPQAALRWLEAGDHPRVWPVIFWQVSDANDGLIRAIPVVSNDDVAMHRGYALQWWLLMFVALFFAWRLSKKDSVT